MKKIYLLSFALLALSFSSCEKDEEKFDIIEVVSDGNKVTYGIECESCTALIDTRGELNKKVDVKGAFVRSEINKLETISISTTGTGKIRTKLTVNDKVIHDVTTEQTGNTVKYDVKVK